MNKGVGPAEELASGFRAAPNQLGRKEEQSMPTSFHEQTKEVHK
jgi:hypothetical protein